MNLPLDVVVELLMEFSEMPVYYENFQTPWKLGVGSAELRGETVDELRTKVREYLLTLVPKPVLLSECEEGVEYLMVETPRRVCREFIYAVDVERQQRISRADQVQVIQPVEVPHEADRGD